MRPPRIPENERPSKEVVERAFDANTDVATQKAFEGMPEDAQAHKGSSRVADNLCTAL